MFTVYRLKNPNKNRFGLEEIKVYNPPHEREVEFSYIDDRECVRLPLDFHARWLHTDGSTQIVLGVRSWAQGDLDLMVSDKVTIHITREVTYE